MQIWEGDELKTAFNMPLATLNTGFFPSDWLTPLPRFRPSFTMFLRDMPNLICLDDILIFSLDLPTHVHHVTLILQRLLKNRLYIKAIRGGCGSHSFPMLLSR